MRPYIYQQKGQAVVEMAIFGSILLLLFGTLLSYLQRSNDQQYIQMEAFRRALEKGCTYGSESDGAGASVQLTLIQNRRHTDLSGEFYKGSPQSLSASSNVFWAVPKVQGDESPNLIVFRVNEDEGVWDYRDFVDKEHDRYDDDGNERQKYWSFETEDTQTDSQLNFDEETRKEEDTSAITTTRSSSLGDELTIKIPYVVKEVDKDDEDYEQIVNSGTLWEPTQYLYRADGQYKYSSAAGGRVERSRTWRTAF